MFLRLRNILPVLFLILTCFFSIISFSLAHSPNQESTENVPITDRKADIRISVDIESDNYNTGDTVDGSVTFFNNDTNTVSGLKTSFILSLLPDDVDPNKFSSSDLIPFDIVFGDKTFSLRGKEQKSFSVKYNIPKGIPSGEYRLEFGLLREGVTEERSKLVKLGFINGESGLVLTKGVAVVKDGKEYFNLDGIGYEPEEIPICRVYLENSGSSKADLSANITSYLRFIGGEVVSKDEGEPISIDVGEKKAVDVLLPVIEKPQSYIATVQFVGENNLISPFVACRWIVRGNSASITSFRFDKNTYSKGDIAHVNAIVTGSADVTAAEDGDHPVSFLEETKASIVVMDFKTGEIVGESSQEVKIFSSKRLDFDILITDDVDHYKAVLSLSKNGEILISEELENEPAVSDSKNNIIFIYIAIVLLVFCIIWYYFFNRNENKTNTFNTTNKNSNV